MKILYQLKKSKKGFTLVEMIVTTVILAILMSVTMGMISSTGRMYNDTVKMGIDKEIGDSAFKALESSFKYSTHLQIGDMENDDQDDENENDEENNGPYPQKFYIKADNGENSGYLRYESTLDKKRYRNEVFDKDFYHGRTVSYKISPYKYTYDDNGGSEKEEISNGHVVLEVDVLDENGKVTYSTGKKTIRCVNLGLLSGVIPIDKDKDKDKEYIDSETLNDNSLEYSTKEEQINPNIYFNCDEELAISEREGMAQSNEAQNILGGYNLINEELCTKLNDENLTPAEKEEAAGEARQQIVDLLGFTPKEFSSGSSNPDELHYLDGVQATKYELYYGLLVKRADKGNTTVDFEKIPKLEYKDFPFFKNGVKKEQDDFFKGSTFNGYPSQMVQLVNFYMDDTIYNGDSSNGDSSNGDSYTPSKITDFNVYSVRWNDWFATQKTTGILWWKHTESTDIDLADPTNSLGRIVDKKRSYEECLIVMHPNTDTWYYMPAKSTALSHWWHNKSGQADLPVLYNIKDKDSKLVSIDIDSNTVSKYKDYHIGFGSWQVPINVDKSKAIVWNSLPAHEFGSKY